jgi:hypothetical protein
MNIGDVFLESHDDNYREAFQRAEIKHTNATHSYGPVVKEGRLQR